MTDTDRQLEAVINALNGIQAELKTLNQSVAKLSMLAGRPPAGRPISSAPGERSEEFPPKRGGFRPGGKSPMRGGSGGGPKSGARSSSGPSRGGASSPARKKGDGYPKKPR
jgi:hypothetical protein